MSIAIKYSSSINKLRSYWPCYVPKRGSHAKGLPWRQSFMATGFILKNWLCVLRGMFSISEFHWWSLVQQLWLGEPLSNIVVLASWRRANARNVSQHTLYGVQHIHINLTLIHRYVVPKLRPEEVFTSSTIDMDQRGTSSRTEDGMILARQTLNVLKIFIKVFLYLYRRNHLAISASSWTFPKYLSPSCSIIKCNLDC